MKKTIAIRTMDEKAAFIAENMELTFFRVLDDLDIEWNYIIECKCYVVEDDNNGEVIFEDYDVACAKYNELVDELKNSTDVIMIGTEVTFSEVDISYRYFIKSSELDTTQLSDLFDRFAAKKRKIISAEVTNDGIVER